MPMIRAMRLLNAIEAGTCSGGGGESYAAKLASGTQSANPTFGAPVFSFMIGLPLASTRTAFVLMRRSRQMMLRRAISMNCWAYWGGIEKRRKPDALLAGHNLHHLSFYRLFPFPNRSFEPLPIYCFLGACVFSGLFASPVLTHSEYCKCAHGITPGSQELFAAARSVKAPGRPGPLLA